MIRVCFRIIFFKCNDFLFLSNLKYTFSISFKIMIYSKFNFKTLTLKVNFSFFYCFFLNGKNYILKIVYIFVNIKS